MPRSSPQPDHGRSALAVLCLLAWLALSGPVWAAAAGRGTASAVDFDRVIRPIISENCYQCHGPDEGNRKARLRFDLRPEALQPAKSGAVAIVPGAPAKSELMTRITAADENDHMPPASTGKTLSPAQIESLRRWIAQGAPYAAHWAYLKPSRPALPAVRQGKWPRNPIDRFILARLEREGLAPSPPADRPTLIRRVALDLTGLPPTPEEVDRFLADKSPGAYEALVDGLLAKPAFGEHWARMWLDLARYADSAGYADDPPRTIWAYRDWVIKALNQNLPFDRFTLEQIAGDLLEGASEEEEVATAFHRNTMTNNEGGTTDEEFRNAAVIDRVNTTMSVWMATSMACAQCHTHKYDPITQKEYFRFFAFFNNTADADRQDESPVLDVSPAAVKEQRARLQSQITDLQRALKAGATNGPATTAADGTEATDGPARLKRLQAELQKATPVTVPVMRELQGPQRRTTHIQLRGNYLALAEEVTPGVPAALHPFPKDAPLNRLGVARWLVDTNNPLTARVIANRFWEQIFGVGIVRTSEDFGTQGDRPTHPELLDWLATELVARDWNVKAFLKLLVTSAAYTQSSRVTPAIAERDPDNRLLARGPRFRASAEIVRDQALAASGLLSAKMYGPPVRPPQPSLGLSAAFGGSLDWKTSAGEYQYRRALYIEWRRTNPYASMATFDAPSREVCALRRPRSNTPLQALVTLNDPVYVEAARALGRRLAEAAGSLEDRLTYGGKLCLARPPSAAELKRLREFYQTALAHYEQKPELARAMAACGAEPPSGGEAVGALAAWAATANVLLNLDEMLMKP